MLRNGKFEQIAAPPTVYSQPANLEIARLFGDPTINLFPMPAAGGRVGAVRPDAAVARANSPRWPSATSRWVFAPRISRSRLEPVPGAVPVELDAVTPLNVRTVLYLRSQDGKELLATVAEDDALRFGRGHRPVWTRLRPERFLAFDPRAAPGSCRRRPEEELMASLISTMSARSIAAAARRR